MLLNDCADLGTVDIGDELRAIQTDTPREAVQCDIVERPVVTQQQAMHAFERRLAALQSSGLGRVVMDTAVPGDSLSAWAIVHNGTHWAVDTGFGGAADLFGTVLAF